jgi:hypothetical protein
MNAIRVTALLAYLVASCAGSHSTRSSETPFETPAAERAKELAPDLYRRAEEAAERAREEGGRKQRDAGADYRTESELWLAAALAEAERIELTRRLDQLQLEEERWARQLARDQEASATVATDISRYRARAVALAEAERISELSDESAPSTEAIEAVLTRVRLNLALAEALGATEAQLGPLRRRVDAMAGARPKSAEPAEALLLDSEALVGKLRAQWPSPRPGASTELVDTAFVMGFAADRTTAGVVVRSTRFFTASGQVSSAAVKRFAGLLAGFPHGPVACQIAVSTPERSTWLRRSAQLIDRFKRMDDGSRVSTSTVETDALGPGTVQCTFAAYQDP